MNPRSLLLSAFCLLSTAYSLPAQDAPRPPREAPQHFTLPDGFRATLFAGEPDVVQPIAICFDDRGRLWVAECLSYPKWHKDPKLGKDRIVIFEDTDGDGRFDKRTVFADKLSNVSGLQYGFGGVWLCSTPNLLYIPIKAGEDVPGGPPQIVLDGWDLTARHNVFNSLNWGPDGWLYGCNGILSNSSVGAPGTPNAKRIKLNCGVWRYHPTRKVFEVFAHGTTNPWGLDWDEHGQMFITNCVIGHLWHVVPGGRYERMFGQDLNPHSYGLLKQCADHLHWGGGHWTDSRAPTGAPGSEGARSDAYKVHSEAGGGHAHSGCMIYLGDNWPDRYRNGVFTCNIHGNRINHDILERKGSTYVARHGKDFMHANDPWFRGLCMTYGPDGGVYVADWCDTGECHNYDVAHTTSGRIYKITYGKAKPWKGDLAKMSDEELVKLQEHRNDWHVRHARRILQERAGKGQLAENTPPLLKARFKELVKWPEDRTRLRLLWAINAVSGFDSNMFQEAASIPDEYIRSWSVNLLFDGKTVEEKVLKQIPDTAIEEAWPLVRLSWASQLHKLPLTYRGGVALLLTKAHNDTHDSFLPDMIWYGAESLADHDSDAAAYLLVWSSTPLLREYMAHRMAAIDDKNLHFVISAIGERDRPQFHRDVLRGIQKAVQGRRSIQMPEAWRSAYPILRANPLPEVQERALAVAVQFGDQRALDMLRKTALNVKETAQARQSALQHLVFNQNKDLVPLLHGALSDQAIRASAIKGLAAFDDPKTPALILKHYPKLNDDEKADAVHTLASRPTYALALLDAIEAKTVARTDLSPFTVRQIQALKDAKVNTRLEQVWGTLRDPGKDKGALIARYKGQLTKEFIKKANLANGRALYAKNCATCHRLFDDGAAIAPDLTGSQRFNLDYVLENMIDPSAVVPRDYQVSVIVTTGGRVLTGVIKQETDRAVTVQTQNELVVLPKDEIDARAQSNLSMMPEGALDRMTIEEVRDLVAYLASPAQVGKRD